MAGQVLGRVLTLAVREVLRLVEDFRAAVAGARALSVDILDAHHHRLASRQDVRGPRLGDHHGAAAEGELRTMIARVPALDEAELVAQPSNRLADVLVDELRNDRGPGHGAVADVLFGHGR